MPLKKEDKLLYCWHSRYDIADIVCAIEAHELDGWSVEGIAFGYDAEAPDRFDTDSGYYCAVKLVRITASSVLGSGVHALAWQGAPTISESPSAAATAAVKGEHRG